MTKIKIITRGKAHTSYEEFEIENWANKHPLKRQCWDQLSRSSKNPLFTGNTLCFQ